MVDVAFRKEMDAWHAKRASEMRVRKLRMFAHWFGTRCPACGGIKAKLKWLCAACRDVAGSTDNRTAAFDRLEAACNAHVEAAEAFIASVKRET